MGHDGVASGYLTPIGFRGFTGCQWDPRDRGVTCHESNFTNVNHNTWWIDSGSTIHVPNTL